MRVKERHPGERIVLLFADTMMEDSDLYRFLVDSSAQLGLPITRIADGRTPWELFRDKRYIGNSRSAPCSVHLKRELLDQWHKQHCNPTETTLHFGLDWTEPHRLIRIRDAKASWVCEAYMTEAPYLDKHQMLGWMRREGLRPPRLYALGFSHNNCGGFCVKAGHAHFALLFRQLPDVYQFHETEERKLQKLVGPNYTILKDRTGGEVKPLSLAGFRQRLEAKESFDEFDFGGCGCAVE
jgi:hypothetical protein